MTPRTDSAFASLTRRLVGDTLRYVPGVIIPAASSLAGVAVFTRIFDAADYGRYALVIATTTLSTFLIAGWIQTSILRFLPRYRSENRLDEFIRQTRALLAVVAVLLLALLVPLYPFVRRWLTAYDPMYVPAVLVVVTEILLLNVVSIYQGALRSSTYVAGRSTAAALRFGFGLALVLAVSRDVTSLVYAAAAANAVVAVPMLVKLPAGRGSVKTLFLPSANLVKTMAAYGVPLIGWIMCSQVLSISDRYIIGAFRGSGEVGIYSANYNIVVMGVGLVSTPIMLAAHPIIMDAWEHHRHDDIPRVIASFSRYYLVAVAPVIAFVSVFSSDIVAVALGESFREGHRIMPVILAGSLVWGFSMYGHKGLELKEQTRLLLGLILIAALANIVLNLIVVPRYGYVGAAVTTLISYTLYPLLLYPVTRRYVPWRIPWKGAFKVLIAAAVAAGVFWTVRLPLAGHAHPVVYMVIAGLLGLAAYAVVIVGTKAVRRDELQTFAAHRTTSE